MKSNVFLQSAKLLLFVGVLWGAVVLQAYAATLSLSPGTGVYQVGSTFTARVVVNTQGDNINAAEGTLSFAPSELSVVRISKGSVFNLWTSEPTFSNSAGTANFSGGNPAGYSGGAGTVISVTFRTKVAGSPRVSITNGAVLAADGRGTNVLSTMAGGSYTVTAIQDSPTPEVVEYVPVANTPGRPTINSSTHSHDRWSTDTSAALSWTLPADVTAVRTLLDGSPSSVPTNVYDTPINSITLDDLEEGEQYFHLQFRNGDGWGAVAHYRLAVDTTDPTAFTATLSNNADLSSPTQQIVLTAADELSGIARYEVQLDGSDPFEFIPETASSTLEIIELTPGKHTLIIEAFDAAGNSVVDTLSFTVLAFDRPTFIGVPESVNEGVIPVFVGQTRPNADVTVLLSKLGNDPSETTVQADESGRFTFIPESTLTTGVYELSARAIDEYGAQSEASEPVRFAVQQPGYIAIGSLVVGVLSIVVPLVALLLLMVLGLLYFRKRFRALRIGVEKEAGEVLEVVESQFALLTTALSNETEKVAASRKANKLTKAEEQLVVAMNASLKIAHATIKKEAMDVDDVLDET